MEKYNFNEHITKEKFWPHGGTERKTMITLDDGKEYMLKLPNPVRKDGKFLMHSNNVLSEYIGCKIAASVGLPVQNVILGEYTYQRRSTGEMCTCLGCAREYLGDGERELLEARYASMGSSRDPREARIVKFSTLNVISEYIPAVSLAEMKAFYADMFVLDAFVGNTDRHNGNWGFFGKGQNWALAPVYDFGTCLCPLLADEEMNRERAVAEALTGMSAILEEDGTRIHYREYLLSGKNPDVNEALKRMIPRIRMDEIAAIIEDIPYISDTRKDFYRTYLETTYEKILVPALEHVREVEEDREERTVAGNGRSGGFEEEWEEEEL